MDNFIASGIEEVKGFFSGLFGILKVLILTFVLYMIISIWWNGRKERAAEERNEQHLMTIIETVNRNQDYLIRNDSFRASNTTEVIKDVIEFNKNQNEHKLTIDELVKLLNLE